MPGKTSSSQNKSERRSSSKRKEVEESLDEFLGPALILVFRRSKTSTRTQFINSAIKKLLGGKFDTEETGRVLPHPTSEDLALKKKRRGFARARDALGDEKDLEDDPSWERHDADLRPLMKEIRGILKDAEESDDINVIYAANMGKIIRDTVEVPEAWLERFRSNKKMAAERQREMKKKGIKPEKMYNPMQGKDDEMQELQLKTRYLANSISRLCYNLRKSGHVKSIVKDLRKQEADGRVVKTSSAVLQLKNLYAMLKCMQREMMYCPKGSPFMYSLGDIMDSYCEYFEEADLWSGRC